MFSSLSSQNAIKHNMPKIFKIMEFMTLRRITKKHSFIGYTLYLLEIMSKHRPITHVSLITLVALFKSFFETNMGQNPHV